MSAISAVSVSPRRRRLALFLKLHPNKNVRGDEVVVFLRHLLRHLKGSVVVLWDRSATHRGNPVRHFLQRHRRLHLESFPGYAPELNPDEFVWAQLKRALANSIPRDLDHLKCLLRDPVRRLRNSQRLLWSCIKGSDLPWV